MKERIAVQTSLLGIANKAKSDKRHRFHNLYKLRGYNNYYGVNGNRASLDEFFYHVRRIHQRWLNQRSQRRSYTWAAYNELMCLLRLEHPRIVPRG